MDHSVTPAVHKWMNWQRGGTLSNRTIDARATTVTRCAQESRTAPENLTAEQITKWLARHEDWSPATRYTYHSHLRAWCKYLVLVDIRADDPMTFVRRPRRPRGKPHPVPNVHMPRLLSAPMRARTRSMIWLAVLAGLRTFEIAKMRGDAFDLRAGTLTVTGKGGTTHVLPLHPKLAELAATMPAAYWFPSAQPGQKHVRSKSVSTTIRATMRRNGVPGTAHSLRHWFATALLHDGADLITVQTLLRHASLATTQIYTQVAQESPNAALHKLNPWSVERGTGGATSRDETPTADPLGGTSPS